MDFDVERPEPRHTGHRWVDFTIAGSALLLSVISLVVAILHGRTMEQMADANARLVQANSWPFVGAILSRDASVVTMGIRNTGVGPAKIHWVEVNYDGRPVSSMLDLLRRCCGYQPAGIGQKAAVDYAYSVVDGTVVRAGENVDMITLHNSPTNAALYPTLRERLLRIGFRICYCSVFDECFIGDGESLDPVHVRQCAAPATRFDENR